MEPFDNYPGGGRQLLGKMTGANCRHEYGLRLQKLTSQTSCAYCSVSLIDDYYRWLLMSVDHVIPMSAGQAAGIPQDWLEDYANTVLCCSACNGFGNRFKLTDNTPIPSTDDEFFDLRERIFVKRRTLILASHDSERNFYRSRPWGRR